MRRFMISILLLLWLFPPFALAAEVGSNDLIDEAGVYNGREIVFTGEVIGDVLNRGDYVWLNVSDGNNAIGVWAQRDLAQEIQVAGRYAQHGDIIRVMGTFNRACPDHGGDLDIHAKQITLVQRGYPVQHDVVRWKVYFACFLFIAATGLTVVVFGVNRKLRRL